MVASAPNQDMPARYEDRHDDGFAKVFDAAPAGSPAQPKN
jgi:hypothetical protein